MSTSTNGSTPAAHAAAIEHAWRYFEAHAAQRMTVFNFFSVFSGIVAAGLAGTMQKASTSGFGVVLGVLLALLSFIFWKLDQRGAFLVKHAEAVLAAAEAASMEPQYRLFSNEPASLRTARAGKRRHRAVWTFGEAFRLMFVTMAVVGIGGAALSSLHFARLLQWDAPQDGPSRMSISLVTHAPAGDTSNLGATAPTPSSTPTARPTPAPAASTGPDRR